MPKTEGVAARRGARGSRTEAVGVMTSAVGAMTSAVVVATGVFVWGDFACCVALC